MPLSIYPWHIVNYAGHVLIPGEVEEGRHKHHPFFNNVLVVFFFFIITISLGNNKGGKSLDKYADYNKPTPRGCGETKRKVTLTRSIVP